MLTSYRHRNKTPPFVLVLILLTSSLFAPISTAVFEEPVTHQPEEASKAHENGRYYPGTGSGISSGYIPLKTQWIDEGFPGRVDALSITSSRSQIRSCANAHQEGDSVTINQGSESTDAIVAKVGSVDAAPLHRPAIARSRRSSPPAWQPPRWLRLSGL